MNSSVPKQRLLQLVGRNLISRVGIGEDEAKGCGGIAALLAAAISCAACQADDATVASWRQLCRAASLALDIAA